MKTLLKEFELQETVTTIGVQCIINSVREQYVKELNKDYFGYANQTIKTLLTHLHTKWCKVMSKECVCVCVFLASGYEMGTVMHEIPISSHPSQ